MTSRDEVISEADKPTAEKKREKERERTAVLPTISEFPHFQLCSGALLLKFHNEKIIIPEASKVDGAPKLRMRTQLTIWATIKACLKLWKGT